MEQAGRKKIKDMEDKNNFTNEPDLTDIYSILHPKTEYTFFTLTQNIYQDSLYSES